MAEKHLTDGTTALAAQPRVIKIEAAEKPQNVQLRVAAYTRVSSDSDDQLNSFAAQNRYYAELISGKAEWRMVDIYADEGITGTSAAKREDFQRMMADCRRGLIDQILVKSISRFARNTKDCLEAVRELKELGVNVRFEREGIDTANVSSELITAIYAAFAQKESESISGNMRWSCQRRMESGEFNTCRAPWGFRLDGKILAVHEEEAEIVRRIFLEYLSGRNPREIAEILNAETHRDGYGNISPWITSCKMSVMQATPCCKSDTRPPPSPSSRRSTTGSAKCTMWRIATKPLFHRSYSTAQKNCGKDAALDRLSPMEGSASGCTAPAAPASGQSKSMADGTGAAADTMKQATAPSSPCRKRRRMKPSAASTINSSIRVSPFWQMLETLRMIRNRRLLWSEDIVSLNKKISEFSSQNQTLAFLKQNGLVDPDIFISKSNELTRQLRQAKLDKEKLMDARGMPPPSGRGS